jgi:hypothetical protein
VEREARIDPPIQTEYFLSGGATILMVMELLKTKSKKIEAYVRNRSNDRVKKMPCPLASVILRILPLDVAET